MRQEQSQGSGHDGRSLVDLVDAAGGSDCQDASLRLDGEPLSCLLLTLQPYRTDTPPTPCLSSVLERLMELQRLFHDDVAAMQSQWESTAHRYGAAPDDKTGAQGGYHQPLPHNTHSPCSDCTTGGWGEDMHMRYMKVLKQSNIRRQVSFTRF